MIDTGQNTNSVQSGKYYNKIAGIYHAVKYFILAVLFLFVTVTGVFGRSELKAENFKYFFKYFQINPFSSAAAYEDITYTGNTDMKFSAYKSDLLVLCDGNMTLYNMAGREMLSVKTDNADTFDSSGKYLAVYRRGGNSAVLYNSFSDVYTVNSPYPITDICSGGDGGFAVVTSEKNIRSEVLVYSKTFSLVYIWKSADKYVSCAELSDDGGEIVIFASGTENGIPFSELIVRKTGKDTSVCDFKYAGEQPYSVSFSDSGGVIAVTDRAARFYSKNGSLITEYVFGGELICTDIESPRVTFCIRKNGKTGTDAAVFTCDGKQIGEYSVGLRIYSIASDKNNTYLLGYDRVFRCGEETLEIPASAGAMDMFLLDDGEILLCFTSGTELLLVNKNS